MNKNVKNKIAFHNCIQINCLSKLNYAQRKQLKIRIIISCAIEKKYETRFNFSEITGNKIFQPKVTQYYDITFNEF